MTTQMKPLKQPERNKEAAADIAALRTQMVEKPAAPANPGEESIAAAMSCVATGTTLGCQQRITLSLFFDGTGNNLKADVPTDEHSNVARLFLAHIEDDEIRQIHVRYVPGLGTYFNEVGDPGGTLFGASSGAYGQERLDWAFKELATLLQEAEGRALSNNSRIVEVRLAVFGFSRGAASARAFCRELQKSCIGQQGDYRVRPGVMSGSGIALKGGYPTDSGGGTGERGQVRRRRPHAGTATHSEQRKAVRERTGSIGGRRGEKENGACRCSCKVL